MPYENLKPTVLMHFWIRHLFQELLSVECLDLMGILF